MPQPSRKFATVRPLHFSCWQVQLAILPSALTETSTVECCDFSGFLSHGTVKPNLSLCLAGSPASWNDCNMRCVAVIVSCRNRSCSALLLTTGFSIGTVKVFVTSGSTEIATLGSSVCRPKVCVWLVDISLPRNTTGLPRLVYSLWCLSGV